jgi:hypothetical protein
MKKLVLIFLTVCSFAPVFAACQGVNGNQGDNSITPSPGYVQVSQEVSQEIAKNFVEGEATFAFDGIADTMVCTNVETLRCPSCWEFTFEYNCSHAGLGDRAGQTLAQAVTPHRAVVTVMQGEVGRAIMDDTWDMLEGKIR